MMAMAVANISVSVVQRQRAARATPPRVVKSRAITRLRVTSGLIDHTKDSAAKASSASSKGDRDRACKAVPGRVRTNPTARA
ncbi:hypothetical protein D3C85_1510590 [compost metagenome]